MAKQRGSRSRVVDPDESLPIPKTRKVVIAMAFETGTILRVLAESDGGSTLSDYASEYGEPGYHTSGGPVLLGDWWCHRRDCGYPETYDDGKTKCHELAWHYPRVFAALEAAGCQFEWSDEWVIPTDTDAAYRTTADSYSWQPTAVFNSDTYEYMVPDDGPDEWLEWAENDPSRCLMRNSVTDSDLTAAGYVERDCSLESGWYGVEDDPRAIFEAIREREPDADVIFQLSSTEQFRVTFCVWVRNPADLLDNGSEVE